MSIKSVAIAIGMSIGVLLSPGLSEAATLVGPTNAFTGVKDLIVDGSSFNVTFVQNHSYDQVFATSTPFFFNNHGGAQDAGVALAAALNGFGATLPGNHGSLYIPYEIDSAFPDIFTSIAPFEAFAPQWNISTAGMYRSLVFSDPSLQFAVFTASSAVTPIPATLPLFTAALGGLVFVGWRRRKAATA